MKTEIYENDLEVETYYQSRSSDPYTLSDLIKFLQELEKLGYGECPLVHEDYDYGDIYIRRLLQARVHKIKDKTDVLDDCRFYTYDDAEQIESHGRIYITDDF